MSDNEKDIFEEAQDDLFNDAVEDLNASSIPAPKQITKQGDVTKPSSKEHDEQVIYISISDPEKVGEGMSAFMVYHIHTKTTIPAFRKPELSVRRRFSDFLGLHDKLVQKHISSGIIIPLPPEKSVLGMTKIKMSKEEGGAHFVEHRRAALERFLTRIARNPRLRMDPDFREFLEYESDLPRSSSTQAISGASVMRLFKNVGEAMGKISFKMDETDAWFEDKQIEIDNLEKQLQRLHHSLELLVTHKKELASNTHSLARSCSVLANVEEHTGLARALSQMSETQERLEQIHSEQADADFYFLCEIVKDHVNMLEAAKETLNERVKVYKGWKDAELNLTKKREQKVKMELSNKYDRMGAVEQEIKELENRVERGKEDFERISEAIKKELNTYDLDRVKEFKATVIKCLEVMVSNQEKTIQYWEAYLPEAKAIS